jgi:hypothetical protein
VGGIERGNAQAGNAREAPDRACRPPRSGSAGQGRRRTTRCRGASGRPKGRTSTCSKRKSKPSKRKPSDRNARGAPYGRGASVQKSARPPDAPWITRSKVGVGSRRAVDHAYVGARGGRADFCTRAPGGVGGPRGLLYAYVGPGREPARTFVRVRGSRSGARADICTRTRDTWGADARWRTRTVGSARGLRRGVYMRVGSGGEPTRGLYGGWGILGRPAPGFARDLGSRGHVGEVPYEHLAEKAGDLVALPTDGATATATAAAVSPRSPTPGVAGRAFALWRRTSLA